MKNSSSSSNRIWCPKIPSTTPITCVWPLPISPSIRRYKRWRNSLAALKRFAAARGKSRLYHETITHAYFFLIRERMARSSVADWDEFSRRNPDLLIWKGGILSRYYQETTLQSDLARSVFLFPDKYC